MRRMAKEKQEGKTATLTRPLFKLCHYKHTFNMLRGQYKAGKTLQTPPFGSLVTYAMTDIG